MTETGEIAGLISYGVVEVVMSQNGRPVQLGDGQEATIEIPITIDTSNFTAEAMPIWYLDENTGIWVEAEADVPIQSATTGTGLVQRGRVPHFSYWNCDAILYLDPNFRNLRELDLELPQLPDMSPSPYEFDLVRDYRDCSSDGGVYRDNLSGLRDGGRFQSIATDCEVHYRWYTVDGDWFNLESRTLTPEVTRAAFPVQSRNALPELQLDTPVTVSFDEGDEVYFRYEVVGGEDYDLRVEVLGTGSLQGHVQHFNGNYVAGPRVAFSRNNPANVSHTVAEATTRVVRVVRQSGTGSVEIELTQGSALLLNDFPNQEFNLAPRESHLALVKGNRNQLARLIAQGSANLRTTVVDATGKEISTALASRDTGLFAFPRSEFFVVRVWNSSSSATEQGSLHYIPVATPTVALPIPGESFADRLEPGGVRVYQLPYVEGAGVHANVRGVGGEDAPQVAIRVATRHRPGLIGDYFPLHNLTTGQIRRADGQESYMTATLVPPRRDDFEPVVSVYVSTPDYGGEMDFELDIYQALPSDDILVGDCAGTNTHSLLAAAFAVEEGGRLRLCPGTHAVNQALQVQTAVIEIEGSESGTSEIRSWDGQGLGSTIGNASAPDPRFAQLTFRNLSVRSTAQGISVSANTVVLENVEIFSDEPLFHNNSVSLSACVRAGRYTGATVHHQLTANGLRCDGLKNGIITSNFDELVITDSTFSNLSVNGIQVNSGRLEVSDSLFEEVQQAIVGSELLPGSLLQGNEITARTLPNPGATAPTLQVNLSFRANPTTGTTESLIADNAIHLTAMGQTALRALVRAGHILQVERNLFTGTDTLDESALDLRNDNTTNPFGEAYFVNNVVNGLSGPAVRGTSIGNYKELWIINNTIRSGGNTASNRSQIYLTKGTASSNISEINILNNIVVTGDTAQRAAYFTFGLPVFVGYNLFSGFDVLYQPFTGSTLEEAWGLMGDDMAISSISFADDTLLTVLPDSPAVDSGTAGTGIPTNDFSGNVRPQGGGVDRGAHEQ